MLLQGVLGAFHGRFVGCQGVAFKGLIPRGFRNFRNVPEILHGISGGFENIPEVSGGSMSVSQDFREFQGVS